MTHEIAMKLTKPSLLLIASVFGSAGGLSMALPAAAHHSFAMFDFSNTVTVKGTVKEFRWSNPHVLLLVASAPDGRAAEDVWSMELTSPGNLTRMGWSRRSFKPGDRVEVALSPLRDGTHGGAFKMATLLDTGQVLTPKMGDSEKPEAK